MSGETLRELLRAQAENDRDVAGAVRAMRYDEEREKFCLLVRDLEQAATADAIRRLQDDQLRVLRRMAMIGMHVVGEEYSRREAQVMQGYDHDLGL